MVSRDSSGVIKIRKLFVSLHKPQHFLLVKTFFIRYGSHIRTAPKNALGIEAFPFRDYFFVGKFQN